MKLRDGKRFLEDFLLVAPLSHALWRSVEAISFSSVDAEKPVLDLGCGFGEFSGVVFGELECGIDINQRDLMVAMQGGGYNHVIKADARKLPFDTEEFSTVISVSVMEHIENAENAILEVRRVLKRNGLFVFSVPTVDLYKTLYFPKALRFLGLGRIADYYIKLHKKAFGHVTIRRASWWERKLKEAGFRVIKKEGTISKDLVKLHEAFLLSAFPSQLWRWIFGKRLIIFPVRSKLLSPYFSKFVYTDKKCGVNVFFVAQKK